VEDLEETWLEEATAQMASEIFARRVYNKLQFGDVRWGEGPNCDYAAPSGMCPDPMEGILHHFTFLYDGYAALEGKSVLDASNASPDPVIYGYSWSFARWITDVFGTNERSFLRSLVQVQNDHGVRNLESRTNRSFAELLGLFSLASFADNYPAATINDARLTLAGWNSRDLFQNMHDFLVRGSQPAFPLAWPLAVRQAAFGNFADIVSQVRSLRGGGFVAWDIAGVQSAPQVLAIRTLSGGRMRSEDRIGLAVVRVQ
jgi:hypothetical protein